jgi:hypothetical protein
LEKERERERENRRGGSGGKEKRAGGFGQMAISFLLNRTEAGEGD